MTNSWIFSPVYLSVVSSFTGFLLRNWRRTHLPVLHQNQARQFQYAMLSGELQIWANSGKSQVSSVFSLLPSRGNLPSYHVLLSGVCSQHQTDNIKRFSNASSLTAQIAWYINLPFQCISWWRRNILPSGIAVTVCVSDRLWVSLNPPPEAKCNFIQLFLSIQERFCG